MPAPTIITDTELTGLLKNVYSQFREKVQILVTPLLTQHTYAGMVDELFVIRTDVAELPREAFTAADEAAPSTSQTQVGPKRVRLHAADDPLYGELRDAHADTLGAILGRHIRALTAQEQRRHDASVRELADFVRRLPQLTQAKQRAATHTTVAELIATARTDEFGERVVYELGVASACCLFPVADLLAGVDVDRCAPLIDDLCAGAAHAPLSTVLRLVCLQSHVADGLRAKVATDYYRTLCHAYGHDAVVPLWLALQRARLLLVRGDAQHAQPPPPFATQRKQLQLIVEPGPTVDAAAAPYAGYAPVSVRTLQPHLTRNANVCVFFVGGCTYGELAALRKAAAANEANVLIATTSIVNGRKLIEALER